MKTIIKLALIGLVVLPAAQAPAAYGLFDSYKQADLNDTTVNAVRAGGVIAAILMGREAYNKVRSGTTIERHIAVHGRQKTVTTKSIRGAVTIKSVRGAVALGIASLLLAGSSLSLQQRTPAEITQLRRQRLEEQAERKFKALIP
jgi:hypothetical protein